MQECPYCLNTILETDDVTTCRVCGTPYHTECIEENGGCALKDCETRAKAKPIEITVDAEPHTMLVLSREAVEEAQPAVRKKQSNPCLKCGKQLPLGELYCEECAPINPERIDLKSWKVWAVMIAAIAIVAWLTVYLLVGPQGGAKFVDLSNQPMSRDSDH